jgi:hypothetical protein
MQVGFKCCSLLFRFELEGSSSAINDCEVCKIGDGCVWRWGWREVFNYNDVDFIGIRSPLFDFGLKFFDLVWYVLILQRLRHQVFKNKIEDLIGVILH